MHGQLVRVMWGWLFLFVMSHNLEEICDPDQLTALFDKLHAHLNMMHKSKTLPAMMPKVRMLLPQRLATGVSV